MIEKKKEEDKIKVKVGRPSLYREEYCQKIIEFFDIPHTYEKECQKFTEKHGLITYYKEMPNRLPTFERFAVEVCGVVVDTLQEWRKVHPEFSVSYKKAKAFQKEMLIDLALRGFYNPTFTIFTAKNITDMRDVKQIETTDLTQEKWIQLLSNANQPKPMISVNPEIEKD